jgi:hypothetical protein
MRFYRWMGLGICLLSSCGGSEKSSAPPQSPSAAKMEGAKVQTVETSAQPGYAQEPPSPPAGDYAAPPPAASPAPPSAAAEHAEAPATTDARARYSRANVQLSEARRELDIATNQRDCANACRALDSMERAASQLCELAQSSDEKRTCKSAQDQVGAARDRVHSACGDCPKKPR